MAQRKNMQKYGTLIFMFIMIDPPAVKTGSEVAMRFVNHHLAPNERAGTRGGQGQSGQRGIHKRLKQCKNITAGGKLSIY